ncbi:Rhodanese-like protein [Lichtheimia hyalospora FSU 10163]|nr:Rhodanese-like protein [Lichtheimia hyalospora FSU 10163]
MSKTRGLKSLAARQVVREKKINASQWHCCNTDYDTIESIARHVHSCHESDIEAWETRLKEQRKESVSCSSSESDMTAFQRRRAPKGASDPITVECKCNVDESCVILFYKYIQVTDPSYYAREHQEHCERLDLQGKVRIANEGINTTLAGKRVDIDAYLDWIIGTDLFTDDERARLIKTHPDHAKHRYTFFKPSTGCRHVFADLSIKVVKEICPLGRPDIIGVEQLLNDPMQSTGKLPPAEFHDMLLEHATDPDTIILDTRNYYESRIGAFKGAKTPAIRKFGRFPDYVDRNRQVLQGKTIFTYCTGGIRCEKATAYMRHALSNDTQIFMLDGGIHNYLEWCKAGQNNKEPLWIGKNYVFDGRQGLALEENETRDILGKCQRCSQPWDDYRKCSSTHCHLLILYCPSCIPIHENAYCCQDCQQGIKGDDGVCGCERQRRQEEMKPLCV